MGKATILDNLGNGQYKIQPILDDYKAKVLISTYTSRINDIQTNIIPATESEISDANSQVNAAYNNLNRVIFNNASDDEKSAASETLTLAQKSLDNLRNKLSSSKLQVTSMQQRIVLLQNLLLSKPVDVWCADCSRNLSGEVATIELYGLPTHLLIHPGHENDALYTPRTHGKNTPTAYLTPEAAAYNFAMFPAWQKWRPTYRVADIDRIYGDVCTVTIHDPRTSAEIGTINVESATTFVNVPFNVKNYDSAQFSEGDRVILRFVNQDYESPEVFGFYENPCTTTTTTTTASTTGSTVTFTTTSSISSTSTSSYTTTTSRTIPSQWITIQGESAPFQADGALYYFNNFQCNPGDLDHTDPPSAYGVAVYTGLSYVPTGYVALARNILIEYVGDSNQTILSSNSYSNSFQDIAYDIPNNRLIGTSYTPGDHNVYFFTGITLTIASSVTIPEPADIKSGQVSTLDGITVDTGTLILTQRYIRNDAALVYRIIRANYSGTITDIYQTLLVSSGNVSNLCMSLGNKGDLIALKTNKFVDIYDTGPGNPATTYDISFLPPATPASGIVTNILQT